MSEQVASTVLTGTPGRATASRWQPVAVALVVPLTVSALAQGAAIAAGLGPTGRQTASYAGAGLACLLLTRGHLAALGLSAVAARVALLGLVVGALRIVSWLVVVPATVPVHSVPVTTILLVGALTVLVEEGQFRGLLLSRLRDVTTTTAAVVWMTVAFTALHALGEPLLLPAVAADSVLLAVLAIRAGSVLPGALVHAVLNVATLVHPPPADVPVALVLTYVACVVTADAAIAYAVWVRFPGVRT